MTSNINNPYILGAQGAAGPVIPTGMFDMTAFRAIDGTVYQNTGATPLFVSIVLQSSAASLNTGTVYVDSVTPPLIISGQFAQNATVAGGRGTISMWVLPNYYYRVVLSNTLTLISWLEWV